MAYIPKLDTLLPLWPLLPLLSLPSITYRVCGYVGLGRYGVARIDRELCGRRSRLLTWAVRVASFVLACFFHSVLFRYFHLSFELWSLTRPVGCKREGGKKNCQGSTSQGSKRVQVFGIQLRYDLHWTHWNMINMMIIFMGGGKKKKRRTNGQAQGPRDPDSGRWTSAIIKCALSREVIHNIIDNWHGSYNFNNSNFTSNFFLIQDTLIVS